MLFSSESYSGVRFLALNNSGCTKSEDVETTSIKPTAVYQRPSKHGWNIHYHIRVGISETYDEVDIKRYSTLWDTKNENIKP
jgi:hypothetical protein